MLNSPFDPPADILEKLFNGAAIRPNIPSTFEPTLSNLLRMCWQENANKRPSLDVITKMLASLNKGKYVRVVDAVCWNVRHCEWQFVKLARLCTCPRI